MFSLKESLKLKTIVFKTLNYRFFNHNNNNLNLNKNMVFNFWQNRCLPNLQYSSTSYKTHQSNQLLKIANHLAAPLWARGCSYLLSE